MISKVFLTGQGFGETGRYVCQDVTRSEVLTVRGVRAHYYRLMAEDFRMQQHFYPEKEKPVFHAALSFPSGEHPSDKLLVKIAGKYLQDIGMGNTQHAIVKHTDRAHCHVHLIANRVGDEGEILGKGLIIERGIKEARDLTEKYGLQPDQGKRLELTNVEALDGAMTMQELERRLIWKDISMRLRKDPMTGVSFRSDEMSFAGKRVDASCSLKNIQLELSRQCSLALSKRPGEEEVCGPAQERVLARELRLAQDMRVTSDLKPGEELRATEDLKVGEELRVMEELKVGEELKVAESLTVMEGLKEEVKLRQRISKGLWLEEQEASIKEAILKQEKLMEVFKAWAGGQFKALENRLEALERQEEALKEGAGRLVELSEKMAIQSMEMYSVGNAVVREAGAIQAFFRHPVRREIHYSLFLGKSFWTLFVMGIFICVSVCFGAMEYYEAASYHAVDVKWRGLRLDGGPYVRSMMDSVDQAYSRDPEGFDTLMVAQEKIVRELGERVKDNERVIKGGK